MIGSCFVTQGFPGFISSVIDVQCHPSAAEQVLSSAVSSDGWQRCVQLYNTSFDQARPQCPALRRNWTVAWHVGIQTVAA